MKTRSFILSFLMMVFCSMAFGQNQNHWTTNTYLYSMSMSVDAALTINGEDVDADWVKNYEIAAFYNGEVSGNGRFELGPNGYHVNFMVYGPEPNQNNNGGVYPVKFKLYDHKNQKELDLNSDEIEFQADSSIGTISNPKKINFNAAAKLRDVPYATLQAAIDACAAGDNKIVLLANISDDVTVSETAGVNIEIEGDRKEYSGTINIVGNSTYGDETLSISKVKFVTSEKNHDFIWSDSQNAPGRYCNNVSVDNCYFVATDEAENTAVGLRIRQGKNINVTRSEFAGLHSAMQMNGTTGVTAVGLIINGKNGISASGANTLLVEDCRIAVDGYGVRADGTDNSSMILKSNLTISADFPVVVRKTTGAYNLTVNNGNNFTALNEKGAAVTFTTGDDGTFVAPTSNATAIIDGIVTTFGFEARIGNVYYTTFDNAYKAAENGNTITVLNQVVITENKTYDLAGLTVTGATAPNQMFRIQDGANVTVKNANITNNSHYVFVLGAKDKSTDGYLTIENGTYVGETTVAHVVNGLLTINGGEFKISDVDTYDYAYLINCDDANFKNGKAKVEIKGGKFYSFNPENNKAEGAGTTFCAEGFVAEETETNVYVVVEGLVGKGTEETPFLIRNLKDLKFFRDHVNAGKTKYNAEGVHVALAANIDMATEDWSNNIGDDCNYTFDGIFDGKNHTISNLNSTETAPKADGYICTGLFGAIAGNATVKNLTIENVNINTADFTGNNVAAVAGFVYTIANKTITIENVTVKGNISINAPNAYAVGTIAGYSLEASGYINITDCAVEANAGSSIVAVSGSGAIIGHAAGTVTVEDSSVNNIAITAKGLVGGLAGFVSSSKSVLDKNTVKNVNLTATEPNWVNSAAIAVGTMNKDGLTVANTTFENVNASQMVGSVYANKPTSVVPAVEARIENVYYTTFDKALEAAEEGDTITVISPVVVAEDASYDLLGLTVEGENVYPIFRIVNDATMIVKNANIENADDYVFVLGSSDQTSAGNLTIENGTFTGMTTVASVTKGLLTINGGVFNVNDGEYGSTYLINCVDANYKNGEAKVSIYGGTFHKFNPENNLAEGAGTDFCPEGYAVVYNSVEDSYTVVKAVAKIDEKYYATLPAAVEAAQENEIVTLLDNATGAGVVINKNVTIDFADFTYSFNEGVGSTGTKTNGFQILKGNTVTLKNGTLNVAEEAQNKFYILVQNYANLNVVDMNLDGTFLDKYSKSTDPKDGDSYVLSNNCGIVNISGVTNITANNDGNKAFAFDVCDKQPTYTAPVVTVTTTGRITGKIEVSETISENIHIQGGTYDFDVEEAGYCDNAYFTTDNGNDTWTVEGPYVAQIGETRYATLAAAITAATSGQTVTFLANINENVTVNKNLTFEGVEKSYTGTMTVNNVSFTVQNVNFVKGQVYKNKKTGSNANVTIKNCDFDGQGLDAYAVNLGGTKNIVIENVTAKDYGYGLLQVPSSNVSLSVKNVTIDNVNYGLKVDYSNGVTIENVVMTNVEYYGIYDSNYGTKTYSIKNSAISSIGIWERNQTNYTTFQFESENTVGTLSANQFAKYVLTAIDATLTAPEGFVVTTPVAGYTVKHVDGVYKLVANRVVNTNTDLTYPSLAEAISAAEAGNTIQFLADLTEDVTINKDLTIDGNGKNYTGNISVKGSTVDVIVKNVNFINGTGYAITTNTIKSITVEDCTVKNYGFGFLYSNKSTPTVVVKGVTVEGCNYGMHWVYGSNATLENVTMTNVVYGLYIQNYAAKTIKVKDSDITSIEIWEREGCSAVQTFKFEGANKVGALDDSQYAKYVLNAVDATLAAPAGHDVKSYDTDYVVAYEDGVYKLVPGSVLNETKGKKYGTLQAAIEEADDNNTIVLLDDIELSDEDIVMSAPLKTMVYVEGKDITLDMNGKAISVKYEGEPYLIGVVCVADAAGLTVIGNGSIEVEGVAYDDKFNVAYVFYKSGTTGHLTIENGTYHAADLEDSMVYTNGDGIVNINGGSFKLDNVGTQANGFPCIFNTQGQNSKRINVNGGTFNSDINHQYWANEVYVPETKALQKIAEKTWTVVEAVAYVNETGTSTGSIERKVGYATLAEAVAAGSKVTVVKDAEGAGVVIDKDVTIDFNEKTYTFNKTVGSTGTTTLGLQILKDNNVTLKNGTLTSTAVVEGKEVKMLVQNYANLTLTDMNLVDSTAHILYALSNNSGTVNINGETNITTDAVAFDVCKYASYAAPTVNVNTTGIIEGDIEVTEEINSNLNISGGLFTAEIQKAWCAPGYVPTTTVVEGKPYFTVVLGQSQEIATGWNWFSSYMSEFNGSAGLAMLQNQLGANGIEIKNHHDGTSRYEAGYGWYGSLNSVNVRSMYMINVAEKDSIEIGGAPVTSCTITLKPGWNAIGFPSTEAISVADVFAGIENNAGDYIKSKNVFDMFDEMWGWGSLQSMEPGQGYMYYNAGETEQVLEFPIAKSRGEVRANMTTEGNYWVANGSAFANNMTITAVLNVNGVEMTDNYEVAAFAGDEVRGSARPIYVESIDRYVMFMTVYGEGNEELTFKYIDLDTYEVHNLNDMVVYADNAIVGSLSKPMVLCYGTLGVEENGFDTMSLYPNPTTTGRAINLEAVCDMVEVFNSLGVKVAEYRNVETIDGIETAGMYVIRVTNGETVKNCRLIVK